MTEGDIREVLRQMDNSIRATLVKGGELEIRSVNVDGEGISGFVVGNAEYDPAAVYRWAFDEFAAVRPV
jgi:hypothetical protein